MEKTPKRAIIACKKNQADIEKLIEELPYEADVFWMDDALHEFPEKLHAALQEKIDELCDYDEIILTYLLCGNALLGIKSENARLIFIKGDDCIYATMCNCPNYNDMRRSSIFISRGWLNADDSFNKSYERTVKRHGEERTKKIYKMMYANYKYICYMQLEKEVSEENRKKAEAMAESLELELKYVGGSLERFRELFELKESPHICVLNPGEAVSADIFFKETL